VYIRRLTGKIQIKYRQTRGKLFVYRT